MRCAATCSLPPATCLRAQATAYTARHEPGNKGASPSDAPAAAEQAASEVSAAAPEGLGDAAGAAKEAAAGAAETAKDAAPSNPFAGFFGGGAVVLGFSRTLLAPCCA